MRGVQWWRVIVEVYRGQASLLHRRWWFTPTKAASTAVPIGVVFWRRTTWLPVWVAEENNHDNAVAESFFQLLKRKRIKRKIYTTRQEARSDVFDYIELFYHSKCRHGFNNRLSPIEFEKRYAMNL